MASETVCSPFNSESYIPYMSVTFPSWLFSFEAHLQQSELCICIKCLLTNVLKARGNTTYIINNFSLSYYTQFLCSSFVPPIHVVHCHFGLKSSSFQWKRYQSGLCGVRSLKHYSGRWSFWFFWAWLDWQPVLFTMNSWRSGTSGRDSMGRAMDVSGRSWRDTLSGCPTRSLLTSTMPMPTSLGSLWPWTTLEIWWGIVHLWDSMLTSVCSLVACI